MSPAIRRVLLIDDDEDDYVITRDLLTDIGTQHFEIIWSASANDALERIRVESFDVILVDYYVGERTGLEIVRLGVEIGCATPMILLTGVGDREIDLAAATAGAADYLEKGKLTPALLDRSIRYAIGAADARRALFEKTVFLQMVLDNADTGIATFDRHAQLISSNKKFFAMLDLEPRLGTRPSNAEPIACEELASILRLAEFPAIKRFEHVKRDGRVVEIRHNGAPDLGIVTVCVDVTDHKRAEDMLRSAKEHAEQSNRAKTEFLANMSQELRTPLNAIIGFSDIMQRANKRPLSPESYREYAAHINFSGTHLLNIINDILDTSKIEAGKFQLVEEIISLADVIRSSLRMVQQRMETSEIKVTEPDYHAVPTVRGDERVLLQVLLNLLSNAVKFTPARGRISVDVTRRGGGALCIAVRDTGIGIAAENIPLVLEPFGQVEEGLNRRFSGTGLGLPLARSLMELHGGHLQLSSEHGVGTTVEIILPADRVIDPADGSTVPTDRDPARRIA